MYMYDRNPPYSNKNISTLLSTINNWVWKSFFLQIIYKALKIFYYRFFIVF